jgi:FemAB-related protein (PEP-CTERM system-associated)
MRLPLPGDADTLWKQFSGKVRNQIRKAMQQGFEVVWGREELLTPFYRVFSRNMRDLGTPVFSLRLFAAMLTHFAGDAEICAVKLNGLPVAAGIVVHGRGQTQVTSASSLRAFNSHCPNMLLYWHLLQRAIERGQTTFDFGRATVDGNTYRFKQQWGAVASPAVWQFYMRQGCATDLRPENGKFQLATRVWRHLPLSLTRWIGPAIVRGIP